MEQEKGRTLFCSAGALLLLSWFLYFFLLHDPALQCLVYVGWVVLAVGLLLIFLALVVLRRQGRPEEKKGIAHTTALVDRGIY